MLRVIDLGEAAPQLGFEDVPHLGVRRLIALLP